MPTRRCWRAKRWRRSVARLPRRAWRRHAGGHRTPAAAAHGDAARRLDRMVEHQGLSAPTGPGMQFEQFGTAAQACMAGLGVALLPLILIAGELQRGELVQAPGQPMQSSSAYYLVVPHDKRGHPPVASFRDWLLGRLDSEPAVLAW